MKAPEWNFIGSNRLKDNSDQFSYGNIVDDTDEGNELQSRSSGDLSFHSHDLEDEDQEDSLRKSFHSGGYINEQLDDSQQDMQENISYIEDDQDNLEADPDLSQHDNIPFNIDEDNYVSNKSMAKSDNFEEEEQPDTLKQMRMMFGSEQRIREQSEQTIQQFNNRIDDEGDNESEPGCLRTPGMSQSLNKSIASHNTSNVFERKSFQDFSMKKFQELMFENSMTDFMNSVERSVKQNTCENDSRKFDYTESHRVDRSLTPKKSTFKSPRKVSRKELELDRLAGTKMKIMSEK